MTIRLYDSAWVMFRDSDEPRQVIKNRANPAIFEVGGFRYDIDGRPFHLSEACPEIVQILDMKTAQGLGLSTQYSAPKDLRI
jgi:hypothetical protein